MNRAAPPRFWLSLWCALTLLPAAPSVFAAPPAATLRPFDVGAATALRRAHEGRPWVLVLWSVSCEPCREELPHWARFRRQHPEVAVELVSTDGGAEQAMALPLLARHRLADEPGWIFAGDFIERLRYAVDPAWHGELPRTLFYDAAGRHVARSGVVDSAWIADWVRRQRSGS